MTFKKPDMVLSNTKSLWYNRLYAVPDTTILPDEFVLPDDTDDVVKAKKAVIDGKRQRRLSRMKAIKDVVDHPGFNLIEHVMVMRIDDISQKDIWDAIAKHDKYKINGLAYERQAIIDMFDVYANIDTHIENLEKAISLSEDNRNLLTPDWMQFLE